MTMYITESAGGTEFHQLESAEIMVALMSFGIDER